MFYPSRELLVAVLAFTTANGAIKVDAIKPYRDLKARQADEVPAEIVTITVTECDAVPTEPVVPPVIDTTEEVTVPTVEIETTVPTPSVMTTESVPVVTTTPITFEVTSVPETTHSTKEVSTEMPEPTPSSPEAPEASTTVPIVTATDGAANAGFENVLLGGAIGLAAIMAF